MDPDNPTTRLSLTTPTPLLQNPDSPPSSSSSSAPTPPSPGSIPPPSNGQPPVIMTPFGRSSRAKGSTLKQGQSETVPPPFPWATNRRAVVHPISRLLADNITTISGQLQCRRCDRDFEVNFDLMEEFKKVTSFIVNKMDEMHDRAPTKWTNPTGPICPFCNQSTFVKTIVCKKRSMNWLFLFLGQILGYCKLSELKYFCKHTSCHRTGAKDRVLYSTYLALWKQLDPDQEFTPH